MSDSAASSGRSAGPLDRQESLARLARYALAGDERRPLIEETVRLVQGTLDAEFCAVFESLPERRGALRLAGPSLPDAPPSATPQRRAARVAPPAGAASAHQPEGLLLVPIGGPEPLGVLAVQRRPGARFDADETLFVAEATDILAVALRRLAGEEEGRLAALHDPLTGLPNRVLILDHLSLALARAPRRPSPVAVLFVDLEHFKEVNDTFGHGAGDELLAAVANRLTGVLRPSDTLGRLGGDEFLVVCEDVGGDADALGVATRLAGAFRSPFRLGSGDVSVSGSVGVALSRPGVEPAALVAEADAAMYLSKGARRQAPVLFEERMSPVPVTSLVRRDLVGGASGDPWPAGTPGTGHLSDLVDRLLAMLADVGEVDFATAPPAKASRLG
jgi:diguanylate cyclase (GGDEF)-like protein